jgi:hypothetical protein
MLVPWTEGRTRDYVPRAAILAYHQLHLRCAEYAHRCVGNDRDGGAGGVAVAIQFLQVVYSPTTL